jgi:hypothetical protein
VTFDLRFSIVTISPLDPVFFLSLALSLLIAWPVGRALGALTLHVRDPWRRVLYLGPMWLLVGAVLLALPNVIVAVAYPLLRREDRESMVCVARIWPTFILPTLLAIGRGFAWLHRHRRAQVHISVA